MKSDKLFSFFRKIALAEGISFLVLLLIAMPLKYFAGYPVVVTIVGGLHGILFIAFIVLLYLVRDKFSKDWRWTAKAFLASILPFGTIIMDKEWKKETASKSRDARLIGAFSIYCQRLSPLSSRRGGWG